MEPTYLLRPPRLDDVDAAVAIHCDPRTNVYRPGGTPSVQAVQGYLPAWTKHWDEHGFGYWSLERSSDHKVVGFGGIILKSVGPYFGLNLYFRLAPEVFNQGLSTFIGYSAYEEAFVKRSHDRVFGLTRPANMPSRKALERLHMQQIDSVEDTVGEPASLIYAITKEAYLAGPMRKQ